MVKRVIEDKDDEDDEDDEGEEEDEDEDEHEDDDDDGEDEDEDHPGAVVLPLPPVVWPAHHHRVRLHTPEPRRLQEYTNEDERTQIKIKIIFWNVGGATGEICQERKTFL